MLQQYRDPVTTAKDRPGRSTRDDDDDAFPPFPQPHCRRRPRRRGGGAGGTDRACPRGRRPDRPDDRPIGAALRQPQVRPREPSRRPLQGPSHHLGVRARGPAGRDHGGIRRVAQDPRFGGVRGLGPAFAAVGPSHRAGNPVEEGNHAAALQPRPRRFQRRREPPVRRHRQRQDMRRPVVPDLWRWLSTATSSRAICGASIRANRCSSSRDPVAADDRRDGGTDL